MDELRHKLANEARKLKANGSRTSTKLFKEVRGFKLYWKGIDDLLVAMNKIFDHEKHKRD